VDSIAVPLKGRVLRANRNSFLTLEIHRIHYPFLDLLIGAKRARLPQQLIDQRRLAVIDVRNDGDVADFIHERRSSEGEKRRIWWRGSRASNAHESCLQQWNR